MGTQSKNTALTFSEYALEAPRANKMNYAIKLLSKEDIVTAIEKAAAFKSFFPQYRRINLNDLLKRLAAPAGKKSFLVFKHNKSFTVPTKKMAICSVKYDNSLIT